MFSRGELDAVSIVVLLVMASIFGVALCSVIYCVLAEHQLDVCAAGTALYRLYAYGSVTANWLKSRTFRAAGKSRGTACR